MKEQYKPKTAAQKIGKLVEELGEVQAAVGKTLRWGLTGFNPELPVADRELNGDWILREMLDAEGAIKAAREVICRALKRFDGRDRSVPAGKQFYVRDMRTVVGNCASWWRVGRNGYTCNLAEAGLFSEEEANAITEGNSRSEHHHYPREYVEMFAIRHVRADSLGRVK